jgi:transcriptional regulator with XRE-family HTH domain
LRHFDFVKNPMKTCNFIDRHVGARLRFLRQDRGVTPDVLSRILAISPGRLDDLEERRERISADLMRVLARVLRAPPSAFFEGFSVTAAGLVRLTNDDASAANDEERLLRDFARIRDHDARQLVLTLVSSYADFEGMAKG